MIDNYQKYFFRLFLAITVVSLLSYFSVNQVLAEKLGNRSVTIGTSKPSALTNHKFSFDVTSIDAIGSIVFQYCDNDPLFDRPCTAPTGLDVSSASLSSQSGQIGFNTSLHANSTASQAIISRASIAAVPGQSSYKFQNIVNPSTPAQTVYVRVSTHASSDGSGPRIDEGSVAFSTSGNISVSAYVPPHLTFCSAITVSLNCSSSSGYSADLGELSASSANKATSQFAGSTNDSDGYTVTAIGNTMTSGNNEISAMGSKSGSSPGSEQFGINLVSNPALNFGQNPAGSGGAGAKSEYSSQNQFKFKSGEIIAASNNSTNPNVFTVSYLVNITRNQAPGVYATTITYVAVATF